MAEAFILKEEISLISKGLYRIVSDNIGPECLVKLRRQKWDVRDLLDKCDTSDSKLAIISGSRAEGFTFKSSDLDFMSIDRYTLVRTRHYSRLYVQNSLFCIEDGECSPGFTLLRCETCDKNNELLFNSLVRKSDSMYLSSKTIRENFMVTRISETHGPCQTENTIGVESDHALTLRCPVWPSQAISFVTRSLNQGWPSYEVLTNICKDGCLFVPINSKQQKCSELMDLEWRMSFSLAEKKLIYSMNHCQFLCYGLTKIFLNEILKTCTTIKDLLCSYFMKTAVFWEIFERPQDWSINQFLIMFWNVFRRLIKWVNYSYCPNFFIPENNMFYGKIYGENQRMLLSILRDLHSDGYWFLLRCPSLNENLAKIITEPRIANTLSYNEENYLSLTDIEKARLWVIFTFDIPVPTGDMKRIISILHNTVNINIESELLLCILKLKVNHILQVYAESLLVFNMFSYRNCVLNRKQYFTKKAAQAIILSAKTYFCINYFYYAKCNYTSGYYNKTIETCYYIKHKLQTQPYMYKWCLNDDIIMAATQLGMSYDTLVQSYVLSYVEVDMYTSIDELKLEHRALAEQIGEPILRIPPFVFIDFLLILCYTRKGDYHRRDRILENLHTLVCFDENYHIRAVIKAISWEILGICQQICGDRRSAYQSYINALNEKYNYFKEATLFRINSLYIS